MCSNQNLTVFIIIIFFANTEIAIFLLFSFICQLLTLPFFFKNFLICIQCGFICLLAALGVCCFAWAFHWWLLLWSMGSRSTAFRLVGSRVSIWVVVACGCGESSQTRDWTHVPCVGRWITIPWASRKVLILL